MSNKEKFEGMKRGLVENNERKYSAEARDRWGNAAAEDANRKMLKLSKAQFDRFQSLEREIGSALEAAESAVTSAQKSLGSSLNLRSERCDFFDVLVLRRLLAAHGLILEPFRPLN